MRHDRLSSLGAHRRRSSSFAEPNMSRPSPARTQPPDANRRLYQELARTLIAGIQSGRFKVGERLPAERELAVEYGVSRPTVREAIIALEVQGLVEVRIGSGAYVQRKPGSRSEPGFNVTAFELTEVRIMFEGEAAALAATLITDEELDELDALVLRMDRENRSGAGKEQGDHDFHILIARATRNSAVANTIEMLWRLRTTSPECALLLEKARRAKVKPVISEHAAIVKALRSRDPAKARAAMRRHLSAVMEHLLFAIEERAVAAARQSVQQTKARFGRART
jgi:GntR family transcriptional regulator, hexuronate regulon transcriptional repressor